APVVANPNDATRDFTLVTTRMNVQMSPDGTKMAFIGNWGMSASVDNLFVVDLDVPTLNAHSAVRVSGVRNASTGGLDPLPNTAEVFSFKWSPDSQWISYVADQDRQSVNELYLVNVGDLSNVRGPFKVSGVEHQGFSDIEDASNGEYVMFSPDSRRIAWLVDAAEASARDLFVSDFSSGLPSAPQRINPPLPSGADVNDFKWANSDYIVFTGDVEVTNQNFIWLGDVRNLPALAPTYRRINPNFAAGDVVNMSDSTSTNDNPVVAPRVYTYRFDVSPDGRRVFYVGAFRTSGLQELNVVDITGGIVGPNSVVGTAVNNGDVQVAAWSPDGTKILYAGDVFRDNNLEAAVVEVGLGVTALQPPYRVSPRTTSGSNNGVEYQSPTRGLGWSPDGRWVATFGDIIEAGKNELFVYDVDQGPNGRPIAVSNPRASVGADAEMWLWSPDSRRILYESDESVPSQNEYFVFDLATEERFRIDVGTNRDVSHFHATSNMEVFWSADGDRIFYLADQQTDGVVEAFMVTVGGQGLGTRRRINRGLPSGGNVTELMVQTPGQSIYTWGDAN
ncbi:MAG: hypothetical protein AAFN74_23260, partial [Myxococcota bacterium]